MRIHFSNSRFSSFCQLSLFNIPRSPLGISLLRQAACAMLRSTPIASIVSCHIIPSAFLELPPRCVMLLGSVTRHIVTVCAAGPRVFPLPSRVRPPYSYFPHLVCCLVLHISYSCQVHSDECSSCLSPVHIQFPQHCHSIPSYPLSHYHSFTLPNILHPRLSSKRLSGVPHAPVLSRRSSLIERTRLRSDSVTRILSWPSVERVHHEHAC